MLVGRGRLQSNLISSGLISNVFPWSLAILLQTWLNTISAPLCRSSASASVVCQSKSHFSLQSFTLSSSSFIDGLSSLQSLDFKFDLDLDCDNSTNHLDCDSVEWKSSQCYNLLLSTKLAATKKLFNHPQQYQTGMFWLHHQHHNNSTSPLRTLSKLFHIIYSSRFEGGDGLVLVSKYLIWF